MQVIASLEMPFCAHSASRKKFISVQLCELHQRRLRVVANFGDGGSGASEIRAREISRRRDAKGALYSRHVSSREAIFARARSSP